MTKAEADTKKLKGINRVKFVVYWSVLISGLAATAIVLPTIYMDVAFNAPELLPVLWLPLILLGFTTVIAVLTWAADRS